MKRFGQEYAIDIGAFVIKVKVKHAATIHLHTENILKVIAGESSDISDATEAHVVVDTYVIPGVGPESPVLEPAAGLAYPLFLPLVEISGGEVVLDFAAERCAGAYPLIDTRGDDRVDVLLARRRSLLLQ